MAEAKSKTMVITVAAGKGGPGKSTTSLNVAVALAEQGHQVVILELDAQGSLEDWQERRGEREPEVPVQRLSASKLAQTVGVLRDAKVDFVVIDTPPSAQAIATVACQVADLVLIPTRPSLFDALGIRPTVDILKSINGLEKAKAVITQVPTSPGGEERAKEAEEAIQTSFGIKTIAAFGSRVAFVDSTSLGLGVVEYSPKSKAAEEVYALVNAMKGELA